MSSEEIKALLKEAFMDSFPYLSEPRLVESLIDGLASKSHDIRSVIEELEHVAIRGNMNEAPLSTDIRILINSLRRLLTSRQRK